MAATDPPRMKRFLQSEAGAAVLWVLSALLLAAILAPWFYTGGKALADHAAGEHLSPFLEWLGRECGRAKFARFFNRALMFSALVLLPVLVMRLRKLRAKEGPSPYPLEKTGLPRALVQIATSCLIAGVLLWATGLLLVTVGAYVKDPHADAIGNVIGKTLPPAILAPLVEECLFRGFLLGLWLRYAKPLTAAIGNSLLFAFMHFLQPPDGTQIADPHSALAGFDLLGKIALHFTNPAFFVTEFATLFCIGMILAWARLRTSCLWFAMGLHAGWVAAFKGFNQLYSNVDASPWHPWGVGEDLRSGLVPLCALVVTAFVCHFAMKQWDRNPKPFNS